MVVLEQLGKCRSTGNGQRAGRPEFISVRNQMPQASSKASEGAPEGVCLFSVPLIAIVARPEIRR